MSIEPTQLSEYLGTVALAVGGLGAASYGVVDGLKILPWVDLAGFERLFCGRSTEGGRSWPTLQRTALDSLMPALNAAYGKDVLELLKAQYRNGRSKGDLPRTLRQGVRIGFGVMEQNDIQKTALALGIDAQTAEQAMKALVAARNQRPPAAGESSTGMSEPVSGEQRSALARLETSIDARIDAALVLAEVQYVTQTKVIATFVALLIAFGVGYILESKPVVSFMVGITAVPLAPVAKDLATALQEAVRALKKR